MGFKSSNRVISSDLRKFGTILFINKFWCNLVIQLSLISKGGHSPETEKNLFKTIREGCTAKEHFWLSN